MKLISTIDALIRQAEMYDKDTVISILKEVKSNIKADAKTDASELYDLLLKLPLYQIEERKQLIENFLLGVEQ